MASSGISFAFSKEVALQLTTPLDKGDYALEDLRAVESLSTPFEISLTVTTDNGNINLEKLMGKPITVTVQAKPKKRFFNGVVGHISQREFTDQARTVTYLVKLYPKFWLLKFSRDFKIFQKKNAITIIKEVLQDNKVDKVDDRTTKCGKTLREYCVQYGESHYDFVCRLMEEEGIFYYFEHANGKHTMVLADMPSAHQDIKESPQIEADYAVPDAPLLNVVTSCHIEHQVVVGEHSLTDYNYDTPKTKLFSKAKGAGAGLESYDYPGQADTEYKPDKGGSESWSSLRSEMDDLPRELLKGESTCPFFEAGSTFTLKKHLRKDANKKYTLHTVEHHVSLVKDEAYLKSREEGASKGSPHPTRVICKNAFVAFPAKTPFRPPLVTQKPKIHSTQTAVVTGPSGEEIYTDDQRRIKVQFHWDREGKNDDKTTCWVRVSQAWAANNWGILFTPRIGMEVVVSFINGDPDRPLVTGCVYNADNVPPYLAKDKTKATIKSDTHKGEGFNELRFEDEKKKEEIYLHAQKDWNTHVLENRTTVVEQGSDFKTIKKGDREVVIKGNPGVIPKKGEAESLKHSGKGASKKGDDLLTIEKGSRIVKIMGMGSGKGSYTTTITKGDRETTIMKGDNKNTFMKGNDLKTILEGNKTLMLAKGNEAKTIGQGNKTLTMGQGNKLSTIASGNDTLLLPSGIFTGIMQGLLLKIGGLVIAIGGGGSGSEESMPGHTPDNPGETPPGDSPYPFNPQAGASGGGGTSNAGGNTCVESNIESPCGDFNIKLNDNNITIDQNGQKIWKISKNSEQTVGGDYVLEVGGNVIIKAKGNIQMESDANIDIKAKGMLNVEAASMNFIAKQAYNVKAMQVSYKADAAYNVLSDGIVNMASQRIMSLKGALINLNV